jgi:hypothetical protein
MNSEYNIISIGNIPTKRVILKHRLYSDRTDTNKFDYVFEKLSIKQDNPSIKEAISNIEEYAKNNSHNFKCHIYNNNWITFKPFISICTTSKGKTSNVSTLVYVQDHNNKYVKMEVNSYIELMNLPYWQDGWELQFTLKFKAIYDEKNNCVMPYIICSCIYFSRVKRSPWHLRRIP